jgi:hypothetical protein
MRAVKLLGAVGHDDQQPWDSLLVANQEVEQVPARAIRPMGVFDDQHDRPVLGQALQHREDLLEQPRPRRVRVGVGDGTPQAEGGHAASAELARQRTQRSRERRERLTLRAQLHASAHQNPRDLLRRLCPRDASDACGELSYQPRLADPGLAADQDRGRLPRLGHGVRSRKRLQLAFPPNEAGRELHGVVGRAVDVGALDVALAAR